LPVVAFKSKTDKEILLDPWNFNIASLTTAQNDAELLPLADLTGRAVVEKRDSKGFKLSLAALISTILLWVVWWIVRHFRDAHTLPFAKARSRIKKLPAKERDSRRESWVALHHAFNDVAGKTVSTGTIDRLYTVAPWLASEKDRIDKFFSASSGRFFKGVKTPEHIPVDALSRTLYNLEKKQVKNSRPNKPSQQSQSNS